MSSISHLKRILLVYPDPYFVSGGGIGTYLRNAIDAHLAHSRHVHLLTWATDQEHWADRAFSDNELMPLRQDQVTIVRMTEQSIYTRNPVGLRTKNISDILSDEVERIVAAFRPDLIEASDFAAPLHTYMEKRRAAAINDQIPIAVFNHGLHCDIWPASAMLPSQSTTREFVLEEQVIKWADAVLAPSHAAAIRLLNVQKKEDRVHLIREPFHCTSWQVQESFLHSRFLYFGRVTFAKGVDIFTDLLTAAHENWEISEVLFLGRTVDFPFRTKHADRFLRNRIPPCLRPTLQFRDSVPRAEVKEFIRSFGFFANFSRWETFSYTTLEAISLGIVPLVMNNSAMAELIPPEIRQNGVFDAPPHRTSTVTSILSYWKDGYETLISQCQTYAGRLTDPDFFAKRYDEIFAITVQQLQRRPEKSRYSASDITTLIATHNDAHLLLEALDSLDHQTERVGEVLVLDDGSSDINSIRITSELAEQGRIRLIRATNMGLVAGRNYLVEEANTELVVFLDADDRLEPTFMEKTIRAMNGAPDRWSAIITRRKNFGLNDHEVSSFLLQTSLHWIKNDLRMTALIKRKVLEDIRFDPSIRNGEADDWYWWLRFTVHGHEAAIVPEPLFRYRTSTHSMSFPWSEGHAALTAGLVMKAVEEAGQRGYDLSEITKTAILSSYRNERTAHAVLMGHPIADFDDALGDFNHNAIAGAKIRRLAKKLLGPTAGHSFYRSLETLAYRHPVLRSMARAILRLIPR